MDEAGLGIGQREGIIFRRKYGTPIVTNGPWGLFTIVNSHCAAAKLLLGEFFELQAHRAGEPPAGLDLARGVASWRSNAALLPQLWADLL